MSNHKIVYSTDNLSTEDNNETHSIIKNDQEQNIRIHLDRKRGGKVVTVIKGFTTMNDQIKTLAKKIKTKCAVGGSIKNYEIIIQGNKRDVIKVLLEKEGFKPKLSGG